MLAIFIMQARGNMVRLRKRNHRMSRNLEASGTQTPQAKLCRKTVPERAPLHSLAPIFKHGLGIILREFV